ncbi:MAG: hypothetical protein Q4E51_03255 [Lachnospiraceae bacterium]|nr:hypothetical protein [Lachnospiraceae bacterium]
MEQLIQLLSHIPNSYYEFVDSVVNYAENKEEHYDILMKYLHENESATPSDIIRFISYQPDFFDDSVPVDEEILVG